MTSAPGLTPAGRPAPGGRGRICIHSPLLYPVTTGGAIPFAGGAEVQLWLYARGLAARGFDVSIATCDFGQAPVETRTGVRLLRMWRPADGLPVVRFFHPRLTRSLQVLGAERADVYLARAAGQPAALAAEVARWTGAGFVFMSAHDWDAERALSHLPLARDRVWFRRALRRADALVVQTEHQRAMFQRNYGVPGTVLANPVEVPAATADAGAGSTVVWFATYKDEKRPEWFVALARRLPAIRFAMHGVTPPPPLTSGVYEATREAARSLPNLTVGGYVAHDRLRELYADAALFVHTSPAEGFPNTVLEAWAHGIPTVTAVDPDGVVRAHGLGEVAETQEAMTAAVARLMADPAARRVAGGRAREHVLAHHAPGAQIDRLAAILESVMERRGRAKAGG